MSNVDPIEQLQASRGLRSDREIEAFLYALERIATRMDPNDLPELHRSFDDQVEDYELFWKLIHLIERYDWELGAWTYVDLLPETFPRAPEWMSLLAIRQLNNDASRPMLIEAGRATDPSRREILLEVLRLLAAETGSAAAKALAARADFAYSAIASS